MSHNASLTVDEALALASKHAEQHEHEIAITILTQLLSTSPNNPIVLYNLGVSLSHNGEMGRGVGAMLAALRITRHRNLLPQILAFLRTAKAHGDLIAICEEFTDVIGDNALLLNYWALTLCDCSQHAKAAPLLERALLSAPDNLSILHNLTSVLSALGRHEEAVHIFGRKTTPWTDCGATTKPIDLYLALATAYESNPLHQSFARKLVSKVRIAAPGHEMRAVLDLGCGTGMLCDHLPKTVETLVGIDLSPHMLSVAHSKGLYHKLIHGDLATALPQLNTRFDTILSACVLYHIADLSAIFAHVAKLLVPKGVFAFSVDPLPDGQDIAVTNPGEYCHSREYLRRLADCVGLSELSITIDTHRGPPGFWCVFEKQNLVDLAPLTAS